MLQTHHVAVNQSRLNPAAMKMVAVLGAILGMPAATPAATLTWDGGNVGGFGPRIDQAANWDPDGLPSGVNSGVVNGNFATTYFNNQSSPYVIAYNDTSSLSGTGTSDSFNITGGADFTFNDNSTFTVGGNLFVGGLNAGGGSLTMTGSASAALGAILRFGANGASTQTDYSGSLTLRGNSSLTTSGAMQWSNAFGKPLLTHYLTLADSALLTVPGQPAKESSNRDALLVVNFEQTSNLFTPTWTIGDGATFNVASIQYQINGVNTTLADERFVLDQDGNSLSLVIVPEPGIWPLAGVGIVIAAGVAGYRRRHRLAGNSLAGNCPAGD